MADIAEMDWAAVQSIGPQPEVDAWQVLAQTDWPAQEVEAVRQTQAETAARPRADPVGARATTVAESDPLWLSYPAWRAPFAAGQLWAGGLSTWERVFARFGEQVPYQLRRWIRDGYSTYIDKGQLARQPQPHALSPEEQAWAVEHVHSVLLPTGAVEEVHLPSMHAETRVCNVVVVHKGGKPSRFCWSGRPVNEALDEKSFKMERWPEIAQLVRPGDWAFSLDFEKGFFQVPLKPGMQDFCVFRAGGRVYRWRVLPFGLASAPRDFSYIVKRVLTLFRKQGIRCAFYIDDLLFLAASREDLLVIRRRVLDTLYDLGFRVSLAKSLLNPGQLIRHLGLDLALRHCTLWVPEDKVMAFKALAAELVAAPRGLVEGRALARAVGKLISFRVACPPALILARGLLRTLNALPMLPQGRQTGQRPLAWRDYTGSVQLSELAKAELRFWLGALFHCRFAYLRRPLSVVSFVDASTKGHGAVLTRPGEAGLSVQELRGGAWLGKCDVGSTEFELRNLVQHVEVNAEALAGGRVHVCTDNVGAAFVAVQGCMGKARLHAASLRLWRVCMKYDIMLSTQYVAGDGIILSGADGLSRGEDVYNCTINVEAFARVWRWRGPLEVDGCAASDAVACDVNTGKPLAYVSPYGGVGCIHRDFLSFQSLQRIYAFPPAPMLLRVIGHILDSGLKCVVVLPKWPSAMWWPMVADAPTLSLGRVEECVSAGTAGYPHPFGRGFKQQVALETHMVAVALNM